MAGEGSINREQALNIVREFTKNGNLVKHMLAVEAAMRAYARRYGEDEETWGIVGLLHDFDWEIHPEVGPDSHPAAGAPLLRQRGVPEEIIRSILSHATETTGVERTTTMDRALYAVDELTGLITAVALVRPSRSLHDVDVAAVQKKWKDKAFARGARREDIERGAAELGVPLDEHIAVVLKAMQGIADELGLGGQ